MYSTAIDQFRAQHEREPQWFGVFDRKTETLVDKKPTELSARRQAKQHNLLTQHETSWCLEDSVMLGFYFCEKR